MNNIKRNKMIISASSIAIVVLIFLYTLSNSEATGEFSFQYIQNRNTGDPMALAPSIFLYLLLWYVSSLVPASCIFLFAMLVYYFLHRKDPRLLERRYHPPYESELDFGCAVAMTATFIATFILIVLYACGVIAAKPS